MFGIFKNFKSKILLNEIKDVLQNANKLNEKERRKIATNVFNQIAIYISEIEGLPKPSERVDLICKRQLKEAMTKRQNAITSLGEKNPNWIEAALIESFLQCNSGFIDKKTSNIMLELIFDFIKLK